jgi:molybdopterin-containing oxidoreductase family membrane subunit
MILVCIVKDRFFSKIKKLDFPLLENLSRMLAWAIVFDLFLVGCDILVLLISHTEAQEAAHLLLSGKFFPLFLIVENLLGKVIPFVLLAFPRFRNVATMIIASLLVVIGIFFMRYVVVVGGEFIPLI